MDAIVDAIVENKLEVLRALLEQGDELNVAVGEVPPIQWASLMAVPEFVRLLLKAGADPNMLDPNYKQNAVHKAVSREYGIADGQCIEVLEALKSAGAWLDWPDITGMTPLMISAKLGRIDLVRYLVERGADVRIADRNGLSALHWSTLGGDFSDVNAYLISAGADPSEKAGYGKTYAEILETMQSRRKTDI